MRQTDLQHRAGVASLERFGLGREFSLRRQGKARRQSSPWTSGPPWNSTRSATNSTARCGRCLRIQCDWQTEWALVSEVSYRPNIDGRRSASVEERILAYPEAAWAKIEPQKKPSEESVRAAIEKLRRAELLAASRGAISAETTANIYLGRAYAKLGPESIEQAIRQFRAADSEIEALGAILGLWHKDIENAEPKDYMDVLVSLLDVATSSGNMFHAMQALNPASRLKNEDLRKRVPFAAMMPLMTLAAVAEAQLTGKLGRATSSIKRLPQQCHWDGERVSRPVLRSQITSPMRGREQTSGPTGAPHIQRPGWRSHHRCWSAR